MLVTVPRTAPSGDHRLAFIKALMWSNAAIETLQVLYVAALRLVLGLALLYLMAVPISAWIASALGALTQWVLL